MLKIRILFLIMFPLMLSAQTDTVELSRSDAEKTFISNNLFLLAAKYSISEKQAYVLQAKLFPNPNIHIEQGFYNTQTKKYLETGSNGQQLFIFSQLIQLAGKINKRVKMAELNKKISQYQFEDLLRTLIFKLNTTFNDINTFQQSLAFYDSELSSLKQMLSSYENVLKTGGVSLKDVLRIRSLVFSLENDKLQLQEQMSERNIALNILLGSAKNVYYKTKNDEFQRTSFSGNIILQSLIDTAMISRPDLKIYESGIHMEELNYTYQKSIAVPDLTIGFTGDRQSNYVQNYTGFNLDFSLPIFNFNQGNIKAADYRIKESKALSGNYAIQVQNEIIKTYMSFINVQKNINEYKNSINNDYKKLMEAVTENFKKHNINLIEFTDFFESYKNTMVQMNYLKNRYQGLFYEINFVTGKKMFN